MTKIFAVMFAVGLSMAAVSTANAADGCGRGWHRNGWGHCVRNHGGAAVVIAPGAGVIVVHTGGRVCPPGWHLNRWGHCRRNY